MKVSAEPTPSRRVSVSIGETQIVRPADILVQAIDVERYSGGIPPDACARGHFANQFALHVRTFRPDAYPDFIKLHPERVSAVRMVPLRDIVLRARDAARLSHPDLPLAEAIRREGRGAYDAVLSSLL